MNLSPFQTTPAWQRVLRSSAGPISIGAHLLLGLFFAVNPEPAQKAAQWVQVQVQKTPEPPPPAPPEPPKEQPKPKPIAFKDIPPVPTPAPPEVAPTPAPPRRVQGLSANSFSSTSTSGLTVRAGNTTQVAAEGKGMSLNEAKAPQAWAGVTSRPKISFRPVFEVPDEAKKANVEGTVSVRLDVDEQGKVVAVSVISAPLGYGIEDACVAAWKRSSWKPAMQEGAAVAVTGMPQVCVVQRNP